MDTVTGGTATCEEVASYCGSHGIEWLIGEEGYYAVRTKRRFDAPRRVSTTCHAGYIPTTPL